MEDVTKLLQVALESNAPGVWATILHVDGSSYRKAGASMVFFVEGRTCGILSAGCLEVDVAERVERLCWNGHAVRAQFDLRVEDDLSWGQGPGCNGVVHLLMEPLDSDLRDNLRRVKGCLDNGQAVTVVKQFSPSGALLASLYGTEAGETFGSWEGEIPGALRACLHEKASGTHREGLRSVEGFEELLYVQRYEPRPRLVLFGGGLDARPLAAMASEAGFAVTVADWRESYCKRRWFPQAERLIVDHAEQLLTRAELTARDYVVLMTHHYHHDRLLLRGLLEADVRYLGVLGPRSRTARLLGSDSIPQFVHSPVGLSIGADGPEEIAVSIVAELIQTRRKKARQE